MVEREVRVQEIAYQLWVQEGRPEGRHDSHWYEAEAVYDAEVAGDEVKPDPPDELALPETATAKAETSAGKAQRSGSKAKSTDASARETRPAPETASSARAR